MKLVKGDNAFLIFFLILVITLQTAASGGGGGGNPPCCFAPGIPCRPSSSLPSPSFTTTPSLPFTPSDILSPHRCTHRSTTSLNWGVIVNVPENFFTITGISLGFAYTILRSWNRVTVENVAWEKRLEDARLAKLDRQEEEISMGSSGGNSAGSSTMDFYTELDLRKMDAAVSKSSYGPEAAAAAEYESRERMRGSRRKRVQTMERDEDNVDEDEDDRSDRVYSMTDEEIDEFEEKYGIEYDPYYDEPYTMDELPEDMSFVEDKVYGDRRYENGEIFYRDERNRNLYWRQGGRPRLKQFWEMFS
jgi:hypothetical protein